MKYLKTLKKILKTIGLAIAILVLPLMGHRFHKHYLYDAKGMSVVKLLGERSGGTGFQVKYEGKQYTLTNYHICLAADYEDTLKSRDYFGNTRRLKVIARYIKNDLCVLEPINFLPAIRLASNYYMHEQVYLIGHPRLEALTLQTASIVSKYYINMTMPRRAQDPCNGQEIKYDVNMPGLDYKYCDDMFMALHSNIISYGGNSGSPVLDDFGNLIGVLFAGDRRAVTASYIVPLEYVKDFLKSLK